MKQSYPLHSTTLDAGSRLRKSVAASGRPGSKHEPPSINVVTVKLGRAQGDKGGHKINNSLEAWVSCDEQKYRQEDRFFNLVRTVLEANLGRINYPPEAKSPFVEAGE